MTLTGRLVSSGGVGSRWQGTLNTSNASSERSSVRETSDGSMSMFSALRVSREGTWGSRLEGAVGEGRLVQVEGRAWGEHRGGA